MKRRILVVLISLFSLFAVGTSSTAARAEGTAAEVVQAKQTALFNLLKLPSSPANEQKISALFDEMLDYGALAEGSLGSEWAARSDKEKAEFTDLLKQLVRKAYEKNLKKTLSFDIKYLGEEPAPPAVLVKTKAVHKTNSREEPVEINFKMFDKGGRWWVHDIVTEGVSLVSSYRTQFTKIVKKDGFPALVKKMQDKLAKGDV